MMILIYPTHWRPPTAPFPFYLTMDCNILNFVTALPCVFRRVLWNFRVTLAPRYCALSCRSLSADNYCRLRLSDIVVLRTRQFKFVPDCKI